MARPRKKQTVSKGKQVKREKRKRDPRKEKTKQVDAAPDDTSRPSAISAFYGKVLDLVERKTHMPSNSLRYLDPLSTGLLQLDRALSGGWHNVFASIAGQEASGKTTVMYHGMANALSQENIKFVLHLEPEGTLNTEFAGNVFSQFNLNYHELMDDRTRLRYYRRQVIEKVFDLAHAVLKRMPDKVWVPETNSWGYLIPKRDKYWASLMEVMQLEADKKLSTENDFLCPTDYSGVEGALFLDSLAAMVTESDDEAEVRSKVRAAEAAAFSLHLKRVVSRISSKGVVFPAVNQLRKVPGQTHGDPLYEPGGEAIKFYCLSGEEYVNTDAGLLTIDEYRAISSNHGLPIVGTLRGQEETVMFAETGMKGTIITETAGGRLDKTGYDHRVLAIHRDRMMPHWVHVNKLTKNHFLATKIGTEIYGAKTELDFQPMHFQGSLNKSDPYTDFVAPSQMTEPLAELIGVLLADGFINSQGPYSIQVTKHDTKKRKMLADMFYSVIGIRPTIGEKGFWLNSHTVVQFFAYLGLADVRTENKQVPLCIRQAPKNIQLAFLKGYLSCDATITGAHLKAYSSSQHIVRQLSLMLLNMGIYNTVKDKRYSFSKKIQNGVIAGDVSILNIPHKETRLLIKLIGGLADYARELPDLTTRTLMRRAGFDPTDQIPELWGWGRDKKAINTVLRASSDYASNIEFEGGEARGSYFYWSELTEEVFDSAVRSIPKFGGKDNVAKWKQSVRNVRKLRDFTKEHNLVWERVTKITYDAKQVPTYDFEVPGSHSLVSGGLVGHNSAQRLRIGARFMKPYGNVIRDKDAPEQMLEPSVHKPGTFDRYKYKYFRNTKNKIGFPGLRGWLRVWVADAFGRVRGFDPVYDVFEYLRDTGQLRVNGRKKGETLYSFSLRDSVGKKRASMYNSIDPFTHHMFKQMILAEVEGDRKMIVSAGEAMGVSPNLLWRGALRESLFAQIRNDKVVLQIRQKEVKADDDDADDVEEM